MTKYQETVLWLGLIIISLNIIVHLKDLKSVIFGGAISASGGAVANSNPSGTNSIIQGIISGMTGGALLSATKPQSTPSNSQVSLD